MKLFSACKDSQPTAAPLVIAAVVICVAILLGTATAEVSKYLLFPKPTVSKTQIAFSYGGDLWIVDRNGGD